MEILTDVGINILGNLVFWLGLGVTFGVGLSWTQRRFRRFFGPYGGAPLVVCLSNLWIPDPSNPDQPAMGKHHLGLNELDAAQAVQNLFGTATFRLPDLARGLIDTLWGRNMTHATRSVSPAPSQEPGTYEHLSRPIIIVGAARLQLHSSILC